MKCAKCGTELEENAMFCRECGSRIEKEIHYCRECGKKLPERAKFCTNCGANVNISIPHPVESQPKTSSLAKEEIIDSISTLESASPQNAKTSFLGQAKQVIEQGVSISKAAWKLTKKVFSYTKKWGLACYHFVCEKVPICIDFIKTHYPRGISGKVKNKFTEAFHNLSSIWNRMNKSAKMAVICAPVFLILTIILCSTICIHDWQEATCAAPKTCLLCNKSEGLPLEHTWENADCENAKLCTLCNKTQGQPLGHKWVEATCTEDGYCAVCYKRMRSVVGHKWVDATCLETKYCSVCGLTDGEPLGHSWVEATCEAARTCTSCGETEGEILDHVWSTATCLLPMTCSVCGSTEGKALGHDFGEWVTVTPATCGADGKEIMECSVCSETKEQIVKKTGEHSYGEWVIDTEPTCTSNGTQIRKCSVCEDTIKEDIASVEHEFEESVITEATYYSSGTMGQKCVKCDFSTDTPIKYYIYKEVTLKSIFSDYEKNELASDDIYNDMYVEFSAKIAEIETGGLFSRGTVRFVVSNGTWWDDEVECKIKSNEQVEYIKQLSVGTKVTVKGQIQYDSDMELYRVLYVDIIEIL